MVDLKTLCPKGETIRVGYYNKKEEPLFFLTTPEKMTSTIAAQTKGFALYEVTGARKAKKLGQGGNPTELELKYNVREKMTA